MNLQRLVMAGLALAVLMLPHLARAQCPTTIPYPIPDWPDATTQTAAEKPDEIHALEKYMFTLVGADAQRIGIRTDSVLIIQNGQLIYERYARGFTQSNRHEGWSVSKSVTHALVGIATQHGLSTSDSVCKYLPNPRLRSTSCSITIENLMEMSSGLQWDEIYENESNQYASPLAVLYGAGHSDMASFVGWHALRNPPGNTWQYSTGDGILLGATLDAAMKPQLGAEWQWPYFFDLVGMNNAVFEQDLAHSTVGGSYFWATPRDMARFGYLYLNGGCWNGQQVLPPGWNTDANKLASGLVANRTVGWTPGSVYGHLWWLNTPLPAPWPTAQQAPPYPDAPPDTYLAVGHWGQFVVVIPSHNMVIIRTGDDRDSSSLDQNNANMDQFLKLALAVGQ